MRAIASDIDRWFCSSTSSSSSKIRRFAIQRFAETTWSWRFGRWYKARPLSLFSYGLTFSSSKIWNASGSRASRRAWADFLEAFTPSGTMVGDRFRYIRNTMRPIVPSCIRVAWRGANFVEARRALRKSTVPMIAHWPSLSLSCSLARFFLYISLLITSIEPTSMLKESTSIGTQLREVKGALARDCDIWMTLWFFVIRRS